MTSTGEQLTGAWLRMVAQCDFVQYNVPLRGRQGEIDVIGLNLATETAYICEVATHLRGLQYTKGARPDNVNRIRQEYQASLDALLPVKQRLADTDWLIDQIVYRLYGLTDEEIAIVEGRG